MSEQLSDGQKQHEVVEVVEVGLEKQNQPEVEPSESLDDPTLPASILRVLEVHQQETERWMALHHAKLRSTIQRACMRMPTEITATSTVRHGLLSSQEVSRLPTACCSTLDDEPLVGRMQGTCFTDIANYSEVQSLSEKQSRLMREYPRLIRVKSRFVQVITDRSHLNHLKRGSLRGFLYHMLQGHFDMVIGFLIILNTISIFLELELDWTVSPQQLGGVFDAVFTTSKHVFNVIFSLELMLRLFVYRSVFFYSFFNSLDAVVVLISLADAYVFSQTGNDVFIVRMVRFARLARVMRVIRTLNLFRNLRVLLNTIAMSFMSLVWSMVVLFVFMLTSALLLCQMLQDFVIDENNDSAMRAWVHHFYGTSSRSLYTVFELTFSGCWPNYARPLIEDVHAAYALFFVLYVTGVIFAMVRIISALFLKETLQAASNDADIIVQEKAKEIKSFVAKLSDLFHEADRNGDGYLNKDDLQLVLSYPKVRLWMNVVGLDVSDATAIFQTLDDGDGQVSHEEFVNGIMHLKGSARSQDAVLILRDCGRILQQCKAACLACEALHEVICGPALAAAREELVAAAAPDELVIDNEDFKLSL